MAAVAPQPRDDYLTAAQAALQDPACRLPPEVAGERSDLVAHVRNVLNQMALSAQGPQLQAIRGHIARFEALDATLAIQKLSLTTTQAAAGALTDAKEAPIPRELLDELTKVLNKKNHKNRTSAAHHCAGLFCEAHSYFWPRSCH